MSRPPSQGAPMPVPGARPPPKAELGAILTKFDTFLDLEKNNLSPVQINQLRQIIHIQYKEIILRALAASKPNPLRALPPALDPTQAWEHGPKLVDKAEFEGAVQRVEADVRAKLVLATEKTAAQNAAAAVAVSSSTPPAAGAAAVPRQGPASETPMPLPSISTPASTGPPSIASALAGSSSATSRPPGPPNTAAPGPTQPPASGAAAPAVRPTPPGLFNPKQMRDLVAMSKPERDAFVNSSAEMKQKFTDSVTYWTKQNLAGQPRVEPEPQRRKRKLREYATEFAPGMELEVGVDEIFNDVLDLFIDEVARGGARVAKHRKANRVETRDLAFFLDQTYGITVPGFDAKVPERIHVAADEKRRGGRVGPPRAAKRGGGPGGGGKEGE